MIIELLMDNYKYLKITLNRKIVFSQVIYKMDKEMMLVFNQKDRRIFTLENGKVIKEMEKVY